MPPVPMTTAGTITAAPAASSSPDGRGDGRVADRQCDSQQDHDAIAQRDRFIRRARST